MNVDVHSWMALESAMKGDQPLVKLLGRPEAEAGLLLARPRVVILDEATAHMDSTSEAAVQEALVNALAGRTALVIAHRLSTIRAADVILVIEDGQTVERGSHAELLLAGGRYAELYRTQFADSSVAVA